METLLLIGSYLSNKFLNFFFFFLPAGQQSTDSQVVLRAAAVKPGGRGLQECAGKGKQYKLCFLKAAHREMLGNFIQSCFFSCFCHWSVCVCSSGRILWHIRLQMKKIHICSLPIQKKKRFLQMMTDHAAKHLVLKKRNKSKLTGCKNEKAADISEMVLKDHRSIVCYEAFIRNN